VRVEPKLTALLARLSQRRIRLGVVSNGFPEDIRPWPNCSLASYFQCTAFSCDEGVAKPDPEIYLIAVRRLAVDLDSTVYVGDGADDELRGAEAAGLEAFRASWFAGRSSQEEAMRDLRAPNDVLRLVTGDDDSHRPTSKT
jgi:putative hydrolase of the HAD superfamily